MLNDGQVCSVSADCASGTCTTFYRDGDADGFGDPSATTMRCGTAPPAGYVTDNTDCCDSDSRARPGQISYFTDPTACGDYDFNCNGTAERQFTATGSCTTISPCTNLGVCSHAAGWRSSAPPCGGSAAFIGGCRTRSCSPLSIGDCATGTSRRRAPRPAADLNRISPSLRVTSPTVPARTVSCCRTCLSSTPKGPIGSPLAARTPRCFFLHSLINCGWWFYVNFTATIADNASGF
jgi:hypothetical protein